MRHLTITITAVLLFLAALPSCTKAESKHERKAQPQGYTELVQMYSRTHVYYSIEHTAEACTITFDNKESITLDSGEIEVDDFTGKEKKVIAWDENAQWMVGGEKTGVYREEGMSDEEALPVYIGHNDSNLYLYISNGNLLKFEWKDEELQGNIPVIYLTTKNNAQINSKETYVEGTIKISNPDRKFWDTESFEAAMKIRGRGNSTWDMPKKPWKVKLEQKARLFDMSNDKEWCLLANYCDKSLLRNIVAMELSKRLGFKWTPKMVPVEVYLNGSYQGVYNFCEHKKVSKERVDIDTDNGDILFELEQNQDETVCWWTEHGAPVMFSEPEEPDAATIEYAKNFFKEFETALWAKNFEKAYEYIDLDSFIDNFIIQELTKNVDGNLRKSTFLTLEKGGKLEMYHVWDFDISMGNCDYYGDGLKTWEGWWIKDRGAWGKNHGWYYRLFMDPDFTSKVKARWNEMKPEFDTIPDYIDRQAAILGEAPDRNFKKWNILNQYVWPNAKITGSYTGEVSWLKENYSKRLEWLDKKINAL